MQNEELFGGIYHLPQILSTPGLSLKLNVRSIIGFPPATSFVQTLSPFAVFIFLTIVSPFSGLCQILWFVVRPCPFVISHYIHQRVSGHFVLCHFNRLNFRPRTISAACNFIRRKLNRFNY